MRRKDREVTSLEEILRIVGNSRFLHLALSDDGQPYVVPLHFGYEMQNGNLIFYMHCAKEGQKLDIIRKNNRACVEIENGESIVSGENIPCKYGAKFSSVIAKGKVEILQDPKGKVHALELLMEHQTGRDFTITEEMADFVVALKFVSECYTGKERKK